MVKITSGSVIGPVLVSELLARNESVIVIMIGSTTCEKEIRNSIDTIMSYQGISNTRGKAVVAHYFENSKQTPMAENDSIIRVNCLILAATWSGENLGLDSKDLDNFLNYERVSKYQPSLTGLKITSSIMPPAILSKGQAVSSVISLIREGEDADPGMVVGYHSFGTVSEAASEAISIPTPLHLHTVQGYFTDVVAALQEKLAHAEELYRVNPVASLNISGANVRDDGMVL